MSELKAMGQACRFANVRTYIASGNLLLESALDEAAVKAALEERLAEYAGHQVEVFVRTSAELAAIVSANPFPDAHGSSHLVYFYEKPPPSDLIGRCSHIKNERLALGTRELYVDYGEGVRLSKLKIPGKTEHTARNINTVKKLVALLA